MALKGKERRQLRALGHHLTPVVQVGQNGVTEGVIGAVKQALEDHELVKVKIGEGPEERHDAADHLARETKSEIAQVLGRTVLLFKKRAKKSKFDSLGKPAPAAPAKPGDKKKKGKKAAAPAIVDDDDDDDADGGLDDSEEDSGDDEDTGDDE